MGLQEGTRIRIRGLKTRPDLNGQEGVLDGYDSGHSRYKVQAAGENLLLNKDNLMVISQAASKRVRIQGLKSQPALNGKEGIIISSDQSEGRLTVQIDGEEYNLKPANIVTLDSGYNGFFSPTPATTNGSAGYATPVTPKKGFKQDQRVRLCGLKARAELNGKVGVLGLYSLSEAVWAVKIGNEEYLLKEDNIEPAPASATIANAPTPQKVAAPTPTVAAKMPSTAFAKVAKQGKRVRIRGLQSKPELNGKEASLIEYDAGEGRWKIQMKDGSEFFLKEANLDF